jgi:hypothetical protein
MEISNRIIQGRLTVAARVVLADKSYDADWIVDLVQNQGANIPMYANRKRNRRKFDPTLYRCCNVIERSSTG